MDKVSGHEIIVHGGLEPPRANNNSDLAHIDRVRNHQSLDVMGKFIVHNVWFKDSRREDGKGECENDDDEGVRHMGDEGLVVIGDITVRGVTSRLKLEVVENVVFDVSDEKEQSGFRPGISLHRTRRPGNVFFTS